MRVAFVACDHGLGHIRRCYLVALALAKRGLRADIFAPRKKFRAIQKVFPKNSNIQNFPLETNTRKESIVQWSGKGRLFDSLKGFLPSYDRVVSDNLPEILELRQDTILLGHFFWYEVYPDTPRSYKKYIECILCHYNPIILASSIFASSEIKKTPGYFPTGLFAVSQDNLAKKHRNSYKKALLISGGDNNYAKKNHQKIFNSAVNFSNKKNCYLFLDGKLKKEFSKTKQGKINCSLKFVKKAVYTSSMYGKIQLGVVRPGIGTVTDLLSYGALPICVYEPNNYEMKTNAKNLSRLTLGLDWEQGNIISSKEFALQEAWDLAEKRKSAILELDFSGAEQAATVILHS